MVSLLLNEFKQLKANTRGIENVYMKKKETKKILSVT